nr:terminase large subunit [Terrisporobacter hibernicus]
MKRLYVFREIYKTGLSNSKAAKLIKQIDPNPKLIIADSAEPKSIDDLKDAVLKIKGAKKGEGSVEHSIKFLSEELEEIIVDPVRCPNAKMEFLGYEIEKDKDGKFKFAPDAYISNDGNIVLSNFNTNQELMHEFGYKPVVEIYPETTLDLEMLKIYEEKEGKIVVTY